MSTRSAVSTDIYQSKEDSVLLTKYGKHGYYDGILLAAAVLFTPQNNINTCSFRYALIFIHTNHCTSVRGSSVQPSFQLRIILGMLDSPQPGNVVSSHDRAV